MLNSAFKIVYLIELIVITSVRTFFTVPWRKEPVVVDRTTKLDVAFLALAGVGMVVPILYVLSPLLDFADYRAPAWLGFLGAGLFLAAIWLLWRSHADLGRSWTPTLALREDHELVTEGVFRFIRHPMYAAHLVWAVAQLLMLQNWIAGPSLLVVMLPQYLLRVGAEERMMIDHFGDEYRDYMARTGRLLPRLGVLFPRSGDDAAGGLPRPSA